MAVNPMTEFEMPDCLNMASEWSVDERPGVYVWCGNCPDFVLIARFLILFPKKFIAPLKNPENHPQILVPAIGFARRPLTISYDL